MGGDGADTLIGGDGDDTIVGGGGSNLIVGDRTGSRDAYVFDDSGAVANVRRFEVASDVIRLLGDTNYTFAPTPGGNGQLLTFGDTVVRLRGVGDASIAVDVAGRNDAPIVRPIVDTIAENDRLMVDLLAAAQDPEGGALSVADVVLTLIDTNGAVVTPASPLYVDLDDAATIRDGTVVIPAGTFAALALGETVMVTATFDVSDPDGATASGLATVAVSGANEAPMFAGLAVDATEGGAALTIDLATLGGDVDSDDDGASLTYAFDPAFTGDGASISGTILTIDPALLAGDVAPHGREEFSVGIVATDAHGATATGVVDVAITSPNVVPVAGDDTLADVQLDGAITIRLSDLFGNDTDGDGDTLSLTSLDTSALKGTLTNNGDGTLTYDPTGAFDTLPAGGSAAETFSYTVADGYGGTDTAVVSFDVINKLADFANSTVSYTHRFPRLDVVNSSQTIAVGDGATFAYRAGTGVAAFVTIEDDQIILTTTAGSIGFSQPLPNPPGFHGFRVEDVSDLISDIVGVTAGEGSVDFGERVSFTEDSVTFNLGGFSLNMGQRVVLDVEFA